MFRVIKFQKVNCVGLVTKTKLLILSTIILLPEISFADSHVDVLVQQEHDYALACFSAEYGTEEQLSSCAKFNAANDALLTIGMCSKISLSTTISYDINWYECPKGAAPYSDVKKSIEEIDESYRRCRSDAQYCSGESAVDQDVGLLGWFKGREGEGSNQNVWHVCEPGSYGYGPNMLARGDLDTTVPSEDFSIKTNLLESTLSSMLYIGETNVGYLQIVCRSNSTPTAFISFINSDLLSLSGNPVEDAKASGHADLITYANETLSFDFVASTEAATNDLPQGLGAYLSGPEAISAILIEIYDKGFFTLYPKVDIPDYPNYIRATFDLSDSDRDSTANLSVLCGSM